MTCRSNIINGVLQASVLLQRSYELTGQKKVNCLAICQIYVNIPKAQSKPSVERLTFWLSRKIPLLIKAEEGRVKAGSIFFSVICPFHLFTVWKFRSSTQLLFRFRLAYNEDSMYRLTSLMHKILSLSHTAASQKQNHKCQSVLKQRLNSS